MIQYSKFYILDLELFIEEILDVLTILEIAKILEIERILEMPAQKSNKVRTGDFNSRVGNWSK